MPERPLATPEEIATFLRRSVRTLAGWRYRQTGPPWVSLNGQAMYRWEDVEDWLERRTQHAN